jgi:hypothetical protein
MDRNGGNGRRADSLPGLGIPRDVDTFLKTGIFQRRLKNKDQIVNTWSEIRAGL